MVEQSEHFEIGSYSHIALSMQKRLEELLKENSSTAPVSPRVLKKAKSFLNGALTGCIAPTRSSIHERQAVDIYFQLAFPALALMYPEEFKDTAKGRSCAAREISSMIGLVDKLNNPGRIEYRRAYAPMKDFFANVYNVSKARDTRY